MATMVHVAHSGRSIRLLLLATRPIRCGLPLAGAGLGFAGVIGRKSLGNSRCSAAGAGQSNSAKRRQGRERAMGDTPSEAPAKSILPEWIRGPQDFFGGLALMAIAVFALWASSDLQGMHGYSFGAGTAPRMFAGLLLGLGAAIAAVGVLSEGPPLAVYAWRGPLFISLAILSFAITIRPLGLVISAFASFIISALGTPETRWTETIIVGICLTLGCSLLFPYALGLPLPLFPPFLVR
jgi:putative tricarboxylic transport membrane protein